MSNFFFENKKSYKSNTKCNKHTCLDPDESRSFHKGKSFRCWEWDENKDRTFLNDEFYQDFVVYKRALYACVNTTTDSPENSEDWALAVKGESPMLKIEDSYWYVSYDNGENWIKLDKASNETLSWSEY